MNLIPKLKNRDAQIGVIGLGYVGLPLVVEFAKAGFQVQGVDTSEEVVRRIRECCPACKDISLELLGKLIAAGRFEPTTDYDVLRDCDAICICVPTPLAANQEPDLAFIQHASREIAARLRADQLVVLESTSFPGTTAEVVLPILSSNGLAVGQDFFLGYSPERVDPGNKTYTVKNTPRLVAGITPQCLEATVTLCSQIVDQVVAVSRPAAAEMAKLLENTFRVVNIALANEVALLCHRLGLDVWEVIEAAATKPFGFMKFTPGPGVGGHCIPVDPHYLSWKARQHGFSTRLVDVATQINAQMPEHVTHKVAVALSEHGIPIDQASVLILGVAYKPDIGDVRETPAAGIIEELAQKGAEVTYHDPFVPEFSANGYRMHSQQMTEELLASADCVMLVTNHSAYPHERIAEKAKTLIDTQNAVKSCNGRTPQNVVSMHEITGQGQG